MESKFKIGDEIYFMGYPSPEKGKISGIAFIFGDFTDGSFKKTGTSEKPAIIYSTGRYSSIEEKDVFSTKEALQNHLFQNL